ncbi:MAG TPA: MmcB family DNA repair protein [Stellaceae bacterium]|nr:MmcB family DNA repair protein [Stellaceae bacterium]
MAEDLPLPIQLARGVCRALAQRGFSTLTEFSLANGRRADVMGLGRAGELVIVEIKSSVQDFRSDGKWPEYRDFCDRFYFAVPAGFPRDLIPGECGLIVADPFGAAILRESPGIALPPARRKAVTLRFALVGSDRLRRLLDPAAEEPQSLF